MQARTVAGRSAPVGGRPSFPSSRSRVVSTASVRRFADRARRHRWARRRPMLALLGVLVVTGVAAWLVLDSPVLRTRDVALLGADRVDPAQIQAFTSDQLDVPLARVDTDAVAERIETLPVVRSAEVLRIWPSTLEVHVVERVPVAAVPVDDGISLVDADGVSVATAPEPPDDLPLLSAATVEAGEGPLRAAAAVLDRVPDALRTEVVGTEALTRDSVTLTLRSGSTVVWGSPEDSARKGEVLAVLLKTPAEVYDVSAPGTPVTR